MSPTWQRPPCTIHDMLEPVTEDTHEVCFECNHVYETEADMIAQWKETFPDIPAPKSIWLCPLCLHDFG